MSDDAMNSGSPPPPPDPPRLTIVDVIRYIGNVLLGQDAKSAREMNEIMDDDGLSEEMLNDLDAFANVCQSILITTSRMCMSLSSFTNLVHSSTPLPSQRTALYRIDLENRNILTSIFLMLKDNIVVQKDFVPPKGAVV
ncbi:hypothetical protein BCR44DRAFT_230459 [Catenaria anguillulae PL171]|uniref:Uncharacterized protein n=1 Tax=Catenaria anguillulae PL171 TaxID=765915 RepID=A0A1Y2HWU7_9FUNG|nr:hypothetical protein BCR44DRAFT_230459 [Catenaria anguillulae PL171]